MHWRWWCTKVGDALWGVGMHRRWWCIFCIFGFFKLEYFLLDFLHFLLFLGHFWHFSAFLDLLAFSPFSSFFHPYSSFGLVGCVGCWLIKGSNFFMPSLREFPVSIFPEGIPYHTKYADKKQIRLAPVWWWLRSWITKVPTVQFTQCNRKCRLQYFLQLHDCILLFNYLSTPPDTHMEQS